MSQGPSFPNQDNPYSPTTAPGGSGSNLASIFMPLYERRLFMTLIGILAMIAGVLYCLTIIGAIVGIPFVIMGNSLRKASQSLEEGSSTGNPNAFMEANQSLGLFFLIAGIFAIIGILMNVVMIGFMLLGTLFGAAAV
ncbi:MAG: DUF5362 family protein [Planctomycetota bacterium]